MVDWISAMAAGASASPAGGWAISAATLMGTAAVAAAIDPRGTRRETERPFPLQGAPPVEPRHVSREDAHRVELIGQLAGGIAHEFNNLLTVMQGHLDRLAVEMPPSPALDRRLEALRRAVGDAGRITGGLLTFAGRSPVTPSVLDLTAALGELAPVLNGLVGEGTTIAWELDGPLPVVIDRAHLSQLVVNLALNARDAMPGGGSLTIVARREPPGARADAQPHGWAAVTVADSGRGMTPEVRAQIFDPFYTTKDRPDHGSGLGLSICLGIVAQAGGRIDVASSPGRGTAMTVQLPLAAAQPEPAAPALPPPPRPSDPALVVLLVEDEPDVRDIVAEILRRHGHSVLPVDGVEAVRRLLASAPPRLDLLLTDLVLADGTGLEAARLVAGFAPDVPVLYMSGYSEAVFSGDQPVDHLLRKPFTSAGLLDALHRVTARDVAARRP